MKGKFLVLSLAIIALSIAGSATTLSYFTDSDSSVANFTIGQVKIRTITTSIARSESLSDGTSLVHTDNDLIQNSLGYQEYLSKECVNLLPDENGIAKCARYIFVQNTGTVPAYVRVKIQIPVDPYIDGVNVELGGLKTYQTTQALNRCLSGTGSCYTYTVTSPTPLGAGEMLNSPFMQAMTYKNEDPAQATADDSGTEGSSIGVNLSDTGIRVYTQAIQAQGFSSAEEAFSNFK